MSRIRFSAIVAGIAALLASAAVASLAAAAGTSPGRESTASAVRASTASAVRASTASAVRASTASAGPARIALRQTRLGKILVNSRGFTLYAFSADGKRTNRCVSRSGCTQVWPLVKTSGKPKAGHGVNASLLGSIHVRGAKQVTYGGHPLYAYTGDSSPGSTSYAGVSQFGGVWHAVKVSGKTAG